MNPDSFKIFSKEVAFWLVSENWLWVLLLSNLLTAKYLIFFWAMTFCVFGFLWFGLVFLSRASVLNPSLVLSFPCSNVLGLISSMVLACSSSPRVDLKVTVCIYIKSAPRLLKEILERCVFLWQGCKYLAHGRANQEKLQEGTSPGPLPCLPPIIFFSCLHCCDCD